MNIRRYKGSIENAGKTPCVYIELVKNKASEVVAIYVGMSTNGFGGRYYGRSSGSADRYWAGYKVDVFILETDLSLVAIEALVVNMLHMTSLRRYVSTDKTELLSVAELDDTDFRENRLAAEILVNNVLGVTNLATGEKIGKRAYNGRRRICQD